MYLADELRRMADAVATGEKLTPTDIKKIYEAAMQVVELELGGKPVFYRGPIPPAPMDGVGGA